MSFVGNRNINICPNIKWIYFCLLKLRLKAWWKWTSSLKIYNSSFFFPMGTEMLKYHFPFKSTIFVFQSYTKLKPCGNLPFLTEWRWWPTALTVLALRLISTTAAGMSFICPCDFYPSYLQFVFYKSIFWFNNKILTMCNFFLKLISIPNMVPIIQYTWIVTCGFHRKWCWPVRLRFHLLSLIKSI